MDRFEECLPLILKHEGGYVNDPVDAGGATNFGITQRSYDSWRARYQFGKRSVQQITDAEVSSIYREDYWDVVKCGLFQYPLDLVLFDSAVQHGTGRAVKLLQEACEVNVDGVLGLQTTNTAMLDNPRQLAADIIVERADFYTNIVTRKPSQVKFANGWANRLVELQAEAGL